MIRASKTIGVYRRHNPLATLPPARIQALHAEAERQGVELFFFDADDIRLEPEGISATYLNTERKAMEPRMVPYPDVVLNEWPVAPAERPDVEKELRKRVPFTTHLIHSKLDIQKQLEGTPYQELLLPTAVVDSFQAVAAFLNEHKQVILKPVHGRKGDFVYRIRCGEYGFDLSMGELERQVSLAELEKELTELTAGQRFLMQLYWPVFTERDEPVDYRAHVQRDESGRWQLTKLYPRIGVSGSIVSNISKGGRTEEIDAWLEPIYLDQTSVVKQRLKETAIGLAELINRSYPFLIDELGIDLLVDKSGSIRFLEANSGPETRFHEEERAIHTIGFARYLAGVIEGRLNTELPLIGMLSPVDAPLEEELRECCAYVAKSFDADFYYFHAEDLAFFPFPFVKGNRLHKGSWETRYMPYPDVIYDRLKARGKDKYEQAYTRLKEIPSTEDRQGGSFSKHKLYMMLQTSGSSLAEHLIPFLPIEDSERAIAFMAQHGKVVLKPSEGSHGDKIAVVTSLRGQYWIQDPKHAHRLEQSEMRVLLEALKQKKKGILAQKFIRSVTKEGLPFHLRIHLVRSVTGGWSIIGYMPYLSTNPENVVVNHNEGFRVFTNWSWFLDFQYPDRQLEMEGRIGRFAVKLADWLDLNLGERISELGIDIGIDEEEHIWLYEVNMNRIGANTRELQVAKHMIPLALHLLKEAKQEC